MQLWRFLLPSALGFTLKNGALAVLDKLRGAPTRTRRAAQYVAEHAQRGNPDDVLRTLDRFATEVRWMMNVGPDKGPLIQELADRLPSNARILEVGAYSGYSSILIASAFGADANIQSIEISADAVASSRANVEMAGLADQIQFLHGPSSEVIATLEGSFDLVFLDHTKDLYLQDLQLIEQKQLIHPGSIVVADNVGKIFGADNFLNYVRSCGHYQSENRQATIEYTGIADAVEIAVFQPEDKTR